MIAIVVVNVKIVQTMYAMTVSVKKRRTKKMKSHQVCSMDYKDFQSLDPAEREWEYDGDGSRIYKPEAGYGCKTPYEQKEFEDGLS